MELLNFEGLVWGRGAREGPDWARWDESNFCKIFTSFDSAPASISLFNEVCQMLKTIH
jgi:hypothetical protein